MSALEHEEIAPASLEPFRPVLGDGFAAVERAMAEAREVFAGRVAWHVNSTARGGGVAELLQSLLAYARGAGVDARWEVIGGDPEFFAITKRIHNLLHGSPGDGGPLGEAERAVYERALVESSRDLAGLVRERDVVFLHDPQTAGLVAPVLATGATVVWRCHVGLDDPNEHTRRAWDFLRPYVVDSHALVFSRQAFVWEGLPEDRIWIVAPSIDAFSPKNQDLDPGAVAAIMRTVGLADGTAGDDACFVRRDGTPGRVDRAADIHQDGLIPADAPVITQVSRWDRLKDPIGVLRGFAEHAERSPDSHLVLAGPSAEGVADDPEGAEVLAEVIEAQRALPADARARTHVTTLPMTDLEENAAMVNAIQRRSDIIVQKSIAEGFGLTVAEAMWKGRAVVASGRGGIQDQIVDGETGALLPDPEDLSAFAIVLDELVADAGRRRDLGAAARRRVQDEFLGTRHLMQYFHLLRDLLERRAA